MKKRTFRLERPLSFVMAAGLKKHLRIFRVRRRGGRETLSGKARGFFNEEGRQKQRQIGADHRGPNRG